MQPPHPLNDLSRKPPTRAGHCGSDHDQSQRYILYRNYSDPASDEAWAWLHDGRAETMRALLRQEPCTVTIPHVGTRITWTIRPVFFLPLEHRQGTELPTCAHGFKPHTTE